MATTDTAPKATPPQHDRQGRRRPFASWMKKLANFKSTSSSDANDSSNGKRNGYALKTQSKKKNNGPYMSPPNGRHSLSTIPTRRTASASSNGNGEPSFGSSIDDLPSHAVGYRSNAPTVSTERDAARSLAAQSHAASSAEGTTPTIGGPSMTMSRGADSTFSSPAPSLRSLTTTLTTVHSTGAALGGPNQPNHSHHGSATQTTNPTLFSHQFPTSPPPSALPSHLAPPLGSGGHPATYNTATANNLLTDNASILTLASSSKRRRRRSMDTDASVRALAPSSLFGGSRESLPLSVLSANIDAPPSATTSAAIQARIGTERASIYSATGVAPALPSERNSLYTNKQGIVGDGGSINSGRLGHGRADSVTGSIAGIAGASSPLVSSKEREAAGNGRLSRANSGWGEVTDVAAEGEKGDAESEETETEVEKREGGKA
ncbi:hypothetical protein VE01_05462 [Pseudogymnoascus verrucosus]|uniref:Ca2+-modulated nonselective cation channel polycystin n=1 Tax=Pseudogymnoascus verrucosus TaxID=342668 RepID=A0A1B8GM62_9PEZI|nr:uncharacterized protein VE01_05462 [Pseudogymnoascus verrucosus]OBT96925.1 hypothetical protein VE01_05462 [Pseudogymnoascus verrucosus]